MNWMMSEALIAAVSFFAGFITAMVARRKAGSRKEKAGSVSPEPEMVCRSDRHGQKVVIENYEWTIM